MQPTSEIKESRKLAIQIERILEKLINRSICSVQVAAIIVSGKEIVSIGWNSCWSGFGIHAEAHAIRRSNKALLKGGTIYVASQRRRNSKTINSKPCQDCAAFIDKWGLKAIYRDPDGKWVRLE